MMASPVVLKRQNGETILAFLVIGTGLYLVCIAVLFLIYRNDVAAVSNLGWYLLNGILNMLTALGIAFLIGLLVKKENQVNTVTVPLSLGLSFLCGVFVPLEILSGGIKNIAKFLPIYWYETVTDLLIEHTDVTGAVRQEVLTGMGVQVLFVCAIVGVGLAVAKYQQQE